jgi:hypothetical protein
VYVFISAPSIRIQACCGLGNETSCSPAADALEWLACQRRRKTRTLTPSRRQHPVVPSEDRNTLPQPRFELQRAGSSSEEEALEEEDDEKRFGRREFVAVELALRKPLLEQQPSCGLAVVLRDGRRIEVQRDFDGHTFERLMSALERV